MSQFDIEQIRKAVHATADVVIDAFVSALCDDRVEQPRGHGTEVAACRKHVSVTTTKNSTLRAQHHYFNKRDREFKDVPEEVTWEEYLATPSGLSMLARLHRTPIAVSSESKRETPIAGDSATFNCNEYGELQRVATTPATEGRARVRVSEISEKSGDSEELSQSSPPFPPSGLLHVATTSVATPDGGEEGVRSQQAVSEHAEEAAQSARERRRNVSVETSAMTIRGRTITPDLAMRLLRELAPKQLCGGSNDTFTKKLGGALISLGEQRGSPIDEALWRTFCGWLATGDQGYPALGFRNVQPRANELLNPERLDEWLDKAIKWRVSQNKRGFSLPPILPRPPIAATERSHDDSAAVKEKLVARPRFSNSGGMTGSRPPASSTELTANSNNEVP